MKYVIRPEPLKVNDQDFPIDTYVSWVLNFDKRFNDNGRGIRAASKIEKAFLEAKDLGSVALEDADHEILNQAVNNPQSTTGASYPLNPARALLPFVDSISDAKSENCSEQRTDKRQR